MSGNDALKCKWWIRNRVGSYGKFIIYLVCDNSGETYSANAEYLGYTSVFNEILHIVGGSRINKSYGLIGKIIIIFLQR